MRPQFAREQVSDLDLEERHVQNMMRALNHSIGSDNWTECVDLQVLFFRRKSYLALYFMTPWEPNRNRALETCLRRVTGSPAPKAFMKSPY
jgi:hypothetical protein